MKVYEAVKVSEGEAMSMSFKLPVIMLEKSSYAVHYNEIIVVGYDYDTRSFKKMNDLRTWQKEFPYETEESYSWIHIDDVYRRRVRPINEGELSL